MLHAHILAPALIFTALYFIPATDQSEAAVEKKSILLDWQDLPQAKEDSSLICSEATEYLRHARQQIQREFGNLHSCIDMRVRHHDVGACEGEMKNLQQSLTLLDDANAQYVSVCP